VTSHPPDPLSDKGLISVSRTVKDRFDQLQRQMQTELGRRVTQTEVMEYLFASLWGEKPC
jgi:hypothetical protein